MFGWLKRWRRQPAPVPLTFEIECRVPSKAGIQMQKFRITGTHGMRLLGQPVGGEGYRLIAREECVDRQMWVRLWKHFNADYEAWTWEDGTPIVLDDGV